jgi:DAACS family dicarboxylate/amino acid:cation (Na+ or H+) symporter
VKSLADTVIEPFRVIRSIRPCALTEMLALMIFALIFGIALSRAPSAEEGRGVVVTFLDEVFAACMRVVHFAMRLAPLAVFAIVFGTTLTFGVAVLRPLALYVTAVIGGLLIQQVVVYGLALKVIARRSPIEPFRRCRVVLYDFPRLMNDAVVAGSRRAQVASFAVNLGFVDGGFDGQSERHGLEGVTVMFAQAYGSISPASRLRDGDVDRRRDRTAGFQAGHCRWC